MTSESFFWRSWGKISFLVFLIFSQAKKMLGYDNNILSNATKLDNFIRSNGSINFKL